MRFEPRFNSTVGRSDACGDRDATFAPVMRVCPEAIDQATNGSTGSSDSIRTRTSPNFWRRARVLLSRLPASRHHAGSACGNVTKRKIFGHQNRSKKILSAVPFRSSTRHRVERAGQSSDFGRDPGVDRTGAGAAIHGPAVPEHGSPKKCNTEPSDREQRRVTPRHA
jgi:hypothetical protein